jgi:aminoglycoside phosphotransferase (APT) family kinase protein
MFSDVEMTDDRMDELAAPVRARLMAEIGLDPEASRITETRRRQTPTRCHIIQMLETSAGRKLVFKQVFLPDSPEVFRGTVAGQALAANRLSSHSHARVPAVLAHDAVAMGMLMDMAPGMPVYDLLSETRNHAAILRDTARWASAFHGTGRVEKRPFRPHFMADHIGKIAAEVAAGTKKVPDPEQFIDLAQALQSYAPQFDGKPGVSSDRHGDLHLSNILMGQGLAYGIDFHPPKTAPVQFDLARLLVNYVDRFVSLEAIAPGEVVPPPVLSAFLKGYDLIAPDDAGLTFLTRVRLLTNWASMPGTREAMTILQLGHFEKLRLMAQNALRPETKRAP